jgi:hypothetical protein
MQSGLRVSVTKYRLIGRKKHIETYFDGAKEGLWFSIEAEQVEPVAFISYDVLGFVLDVARIIEVYIRLPTKNGKSLKT